MAKQAKVHPHFGAHVPAGRVSEITITNDRTAYKGQ